KMAYRIVLEKENFKFSGSHFTIFDSTRSERLHGHNYYVRLEVRVRELDPELGMAFDFNLLKPIVRQITESLDEYVLLPEKSPHVAIERTTTSVIASFNGKRYEFPSEDVRLLPIVNVTSELLASYIAGEIVDRL